jgi:hypothetical protein
MDDLSTPQNNSIVQIKVGEKVFDAVYEPRCKVCNHPARFSIEEKLLMGHRYTEIARWVSDVRSRKPDGEVEDWPELEAVNVKTHYQRNHVPLDSEMLAEFSKRRAEELGQDYEDAMIPVVDHVVVQQAILAKGYERLVKDEINPDVKDLLTASKLLGDFAKDKAQNSTIEEWQTFMALYFEAVRSVVAPEQWQQIKLAIQHHPVMRAMDARRQIEASKE